MFSDLQVYMCLHLRQLLKVLYVAGLNLEVMRQAVRTLDVSKAVATKVKDRALLTTEIINGGYGLVEVKNQSGLVGWRSSCVRV